MSPRQRKWGKAAIIGGTTAYWFYFLTFDIALSRPSNSYELASRVAIGFLGLVGAVSLWYQLRSDKRKLGDIRTTSIQKAALSSPSLGVRSAKKELEKKPQEVSESIQKGGAQGPNETSPKQRETIQFGIPRLGRIAFFVIFTFFGIAFVGAYLGIIYALSLTGVQAFVQLNNLVESEQSAPLGGNIATFIWLMGYFTNFMVAGYIWKKKHSVG